MAKKAANKIVGRESLNSGLKKAFVNLANKGDSDLRVTQAASEFRKKLLFTGLLEFDLNIRIAFGSRLEIVGEQHSGKSLLTYMLLGAFQKTCRRCFTPIIPFLNDSTGEVVTKCSCQENDPCSVVYVDAEDEFDPAWAHTWGFKLSDKLNIGSEDAGLEQVSEGLFITPDAKVAVIRVVTSEQVSEVMKSLLEGNAVDAFAIDSIAALSPKERLEGKVQPGAKARAIGALVDNLHFGQSAAWIKNRIQPTLICTNQFRNKLNLRHPAENPLAPAGGAALRYMISQSLELRSKYNDGMEGGYQVEHTYLDWTAISKKDKVGGGTTQARAQARVYLKHWKQNRISYLPGETDDGTRLMALIKQCADGNELGLSPNPKWFEATKNGYIVLGRKFKTATEIKQFLMRPDIQYMIRLPLFAIFFNPSLRAHLLPEVYNYTPWPEQEPILELIEELKEKLGKYVQPDVRRTGTIEAEETSNVSESDSGE